MVKRRNLSVDPATEIREIVEALAKRDGQTLTTAPGIKDLGEYGDVIWEDTDPDTGAPRGRSVRRFAVELDSTVERAAALESRLADSESELDEARAGLANLREKELPALKERLSNVGDIDFSEFDAKIAAAEAQIAATEQAWREAVEGEKKAREEGDAAAREALDDGLADQFATLDGAIENAKGEASQALDSAKAELDSADAALSRKIDGVFRNMTVTDTGYLSNAVIGELAARIAKVIELEASRITAGEIGARQINVVELAGEVARFISLDLSQLRVTDKAELNEAVAQAIASRTAEFQKAFIQNLRTNGAAIDEAVIGDLAANIITSGLFRTAKEGQRWEIDSNGIIMYTPDDEGTDIEVVRLGPSSDNLITVGGSTMSPANVSSPLGNFDSVTVGGDDLLELIAALPKGRIAQNTYTVNSDFSDRAQSRLSTSFTVEPYRRYRVTVNPFYMQTKGNSAVNYKLAYTWDKLTTNWEANALAQGRSQLPDGKAHTVPGLAADLPTSNDGAPREIFVTLLVEPTTQPVRVLGRADYPVTISVDDLGLRSDNSGSHWTVGSVTETESNVSSTVAAPTTVTRTVTWDAAGYGGDTRNGHVIQGTYGRYGNRTGGWIAHNSMMDTLRGAKVHKIEIYLRNAHWYYGKGGTAVIRPNNGSYKWSFEAKMLSGGWPRGASRWVTLPGDWGQHFASGLYRGISLYTTNPSGEYYGRFWGNGMKFRVTFTK